jgi:hypothetical protein
MAALRVQQVAEVKTETWRHIPGAVAAWKKKNKRFVGEWAEADGTELYNDISCVVCFWNIHGRKPVPSDGKIRPAKTKKNGKRIHTCQMSRTRTNHRRRTDCRINIRQRDLVLKIRKKQAQNAVKLRSDQDGRNGELDDLPFGNLFPEDESEEQPLAYDHMCSFSECMTQIPKVYGDRVRAKKQKRDMRRQICDDRM